MGKKYFIHIYEALETSRGQKKHKEGDHPYPQPETYILEGIQQPIPLLGTIS